ncbi:MAG TPA: folate-binding protein [Pseudolabrys sp.]|jgi:folate-binding protein YgfZ|nr:folate-binding protein [Pseudolabrys sp.]
MKAALLPHRGVVKVAGDDARRFLNGLVTNDMGKVAPEAPRFAALLTPQGKIIVDFIVAEAPEKDGGGFFLDCPGALAITLVDKLNFYKLRAKVLAEDLSAVLGVMAVWDGTGNTEYGLCYADPRLPALGMRIMLPPHLADKAAADLGAALLDAEAYEAHRIALGVPQGGADFVYGNTFPHEADMDQLAGVDFQKGCYVGQEVVSRVEHRASARSRIVPIAYEQFAPASGEPVMAGEKEIGTLMSTAKGRGLALVRLDKFADAGGAAITCGNLPIRIVKPDWATFPWPGNA